MSIERARAYFTKQEMVDRIIEFPVSSATVELAAQAAHCEPARICKTLSFFIHEQPILILFAGDVKVDNHKFKMQFGVKATMMPFDDVEKVIGHAVGGVCPFGINPGIDVYLDESLKRFKSVYPACGSDNSAIELTIPELEKYSGYKAWINVGKGWE